MTIFTKLPKKKQQQQQQQQAGIMSVPRLNFHELATRTENRATSPENQESRIEHQEPRAKNREPPNPSLCSFLIPPPISVVQTLSAFWSSLWHGPLYKCTGKFLPYKEIFEKLNILYIYIDCVQIWLKFYIYFIDFLKNPVNFARCSLPVWLVHAAGTTHGYEALNWRWSCLTLIFNCCLCHKGIAFVSAEFEYDFDLQLDLDFDQFCLAVLCSAPLWSVCLTCSRFGD